MTAAILTTRMALGIEFCPTCAVDTLPDARSGRCFWCDTKLAKPDPRHRISRNDKEECKECGTLFPYNPRTATKRYCSKKCRQDKWLRTEAGMAWSKTKRANANAKRAHLRSLGVKRTAYGSPL